MYVCNPLFDAILSVEILKLSITYTLTDEIFNWGQGME